MKNRRSFYLAIAGHEIHVSEWGDPAAPALVMWHGLARTGRDFDTAAAFFADRYRVICPDTIGRGLSSWSTAPDTDYTLPVYCGIAIGLLEALGITSCRWVGTSMGGLIGMALAASDLGRGRIDKLVVNDIGPALNADAVNRIKAYVSMVPEFATMDEFERFLRVVYTPFGQLSDAEWRLMAETSVRRRDNGKLSSHFDPAVMRVFCEQFDGSEAWEMWDAIACPTLALRGAVSDLLLAETATEMTRRGPKPALITVPGCGHAPMLNVPSQLQPVAAFLA
ncbi:alpha/beta fold hydrolase [Magnetospirillum sulfuroxidans]|uniref:Alpha/beta hydrolase n=1 Tax=Magnetospirillum sulfuroxidans TaxID=611300 RepID=A0ABS5I7G4_9PROT|nr:alpha/beta hydrolase [Magnetospirillum sulfuroxidans]MBR9970355.1 alpha/beta hydrolase [Magnetospirillum sulfuroxidans]